MVQFLWVHESYLKILCTFLYAQNISPLSPSCMFFRQGLTEAHDGMELKKRISLASNR